MKANWGLDPGIYELSLNKPTETDQVVTELSGGTLFGLSPQALKPNDRKRKFAFYWGPEASSYFLLDNVEDELLLRVGNKSSKHNARDITNDLLQQVGLRDIIPSSRWISPNALSGGQQQRLVAALLLAELPQTVIAQTPLVYVDKEGRLAIYKRFIQMTKESGTVFIVTGEDKSVTKALNFKCVEWAERSLVLGSRVSLSENTPQKRIARVNVRIGQEHRKKSIQISNVEWRYPDGRLGITVSSLSLYEGEICIVCGPNGGGKSSLLRLLFSNWKVPKKSQFMFRQQPIKNPFHELVKTGRISFVFQDPNSHVTPGTVMESLSATEIPESTISAFGLNDYHDHELIIAPFWVKQAVALVSALSMDADIIVLDEPIDGFAYEILQKPTVEALLHAKSCGKCVVLVTHNADLAWALADKFVWIQQNIVALETERLNIPEGPEEFLKWLEQ